MKQPQSSRSPSSPPLVTRVRGQLGTILLLGCKGGQNVPEYRPRAVSHDFHPLTFQYGKIPNRCKSTVLSVLSIHGVAVRKETWGGNPSTRGPGDQVTPQSPGTRKAHHPLSALCLKVRGPTLIPRGGTRHYGPKGLPFLADTFHPPRSSFSTQSGSGSRDGTPSPDHTGKRWL